jgi:hypothetical protein
VTDDDRGAPEGYARLTIICDDSRHARGKVAVIETVHRVGGRWIARADRGRIGASDPIVLAAVEEYRRPDDPAAGPAWGSLRWRRIGSDRGANRRRYRCKLCGVTVEATEPVLARALDRLAAEGNPRPRLCHLKLLASSRT